jgi:hypothetical protein
MATALSVAALFAERDALRRRDTQAEEQLHRQREEELVMRSFNPAWTESSAPSSVARLN